MPILIALLTFAAVSAAIYALFSAPPSDVSQRLTNYATGGRYTAPQEEPPAGVMDRLGKPLYRALQSILPAGSMDKLRARLTSAGDPITLQGLLVVWLAMALVLPAIYFFLVSVGGGGFGSQQMLFMFIIFALGAFVPHMLLKSKVKARQKKILKSLPDAIDLLTTSVEAGMGIDQALGQVAEKVTGPISVELRKVLRDMAIGSTRRESLTGLAERTGVPDVQQFINAIIQAEEMGVTLGQVIRVQADQMRVKRRQRAQELAFKAPVKMVFPLVLFIFPALFVVVLGPAMITIMNTL